MNKPHKIYAEHVEPDAMEQFETVMAHPAIVKGALMPDVHLGYTMPIGAVVASKDMVFPSFVGYDIGCGVLAVLIPNIERADIEEYKDTIFDAIYRSVPVGFNVNKKTTGEVLGDWHFVSPIHMSGWGENIARWKGYRSAMGSLGSGNHFIEIGYDRTDQVWIIVHSGSRGVGYGIATYYMTLASNDSTLYGRRFDEINDHWKNRDADRYTRNRDQFIQKQVAKEKPKEGCYGFDVNSRQGKDYIKDQNWCLEFALANRNEIAARVYQCIIDATGTHYVPDVFGTDKFKINRNHNHVVEKDGLWIHRKGATHAEKGMKGVIPANMRDGSFIVRGKGNPESLYSSSHGAGRVMGRKQAKQNLSQSDFESDMKGIKAKITDNLDEAPRAYKNIYDVMEQQSDLVEVIHHVKPLINIKG